MSDVVVTLKKIKKKVLHQIGLGSNAGSYRLHLLCSRPQQKEEQHQLSLLIFVFFIRHKIKLACVFCYF